MNPTTSNIAIVVLAAGESSRMGKPKQLLPWGETILINHVINTVRTIDNEGVFVVLGAFHKEIESRINSDVTILINPSWRMGIGTSIKKAVDFISELRDVQGIMFLLVDQPLLSSEDILLLAEKFRDHPSKIIASEYSNNVIGVPAIFGRQFFVKLTTIKGDVGARKLIRAHMDYVIPVTLNHDLTDVDTPEAYETLSRKILPK